MLLSWHKLVHPMSIGSYCDMSCDCMSRASKTMGSGACPERCCHPIAKSLRVMSHQLTHTCARAAGHALWKRSWSVLS